MNVLTTPGRNAWTRIQLDFLFFSSEYVVCAVTERSTRWPCSDSGAFLDAASRSLIVLSCSRNLSAMKLMAGK